MYYVNGNYEEFDIPTWLKENYDSLTTEDSLLSREECLAVLGYLVGVDYTLSYSILYIDDEVFKGIGLFGDIKVAFFGSKYGSTKLAIPYDEYEESNLSDNDRTNITNDLKQFFQNSVRYN